MEKINTFHFSDDTGIGYRGLQITPDTSYSLASYRQHKSGRVLYYKPFQLWEEKSNSSPGWVASFTSDFTVNIYRFDGTPGEGFAFIIAPDLNHPSNSAGQYLGLTNSSTNGNSSNKFIAIELDTVKQDFDPDDNHMGLNINGIQSIQTTSLSKFNIIIAPEKARNYSVRVNYDGDNKVIEVYMGEENKDLKGPILRYSGFNIRDYVKQNSYFGFTASTGNFTQLNCVLTWKMELVAYSKRKMELVAYSKPKISKKWVKIVVYTGAIGGVIILCLASLKYYLNKKRVFDDPILVGALKRLPGTPREFKFKNVKKATNNFDEKLKLGQGGFGVVYKGVLPKDGTIVAVKKFSRDSMKGRDDFLAELTIINRLRHKHLVPLIGWSYRNGMLLLVYEYMPNGSLDNHLFNGLDKILSWESRHKIISGVASALHYLHNDYDQKVVHRDLKASNIMLDSDFNARLGDFGLARALDNGKTSYAELEGVPGTRGYIAPECILAGKATRDSDIYGFGAVILEVMCGRRPWTEISGHHLLIDWVWTLYREGRILEAMDERLGNNYLVEDAHRLLLLGLACSHPTAKERPKTQIIIQIISGSIQVPYVPLFRPTFTWHMTEPTDDDIMTGTTDGTP
ncbi:hypothetical protein GIB67_041352 [Kingdonia uniflora]|uniref:Protein kinase domain-containing protein n=1 Tax=Kingdonia uniflora TaxID=39325 RepID=A0A7J7NIU9_9MAGN|nr:hypothetical protein GIB67_041352 [Kingdonia uniflora]